MSGNDVTMAAPEITRKWGRLMENLANARAVFRGMWRWPETWAAVCIALLLGRLVVNAGVQEKLAEHNKAQIEVIKEQNDHSIQDRTFLHAELANTKAALRRLEKTVKTGEYP